MLLLIIINLFRSISVDGSGRGRTCQSSSWDHVFLGLFWMVRRVDNVKFALANI